MKQPHMIPYPLIRTNQWFIIISVALAWTTGAYAWLLAPLMAGLCGLLFGVNPVMCQGRNHFDPFRRNKLTHLGELRCCSWQPFNCRVTVCLSVEIDSCWWWFFGGGL